MQPSVEMECLDETAVLLEEPCDRADYPLYPLSKIVRLVVGLRPKLGREGREAPIILRVEIREDGLLACEAAVEVPHRHPGPPSDIRDRHPIERHLPELFDARRHQALMRLP